MLETFETLEAWTLWVSLTLLGGFCLAVSVVIAWKRLEQHGRILLQLRWASRVVAVALVVVCVMRGATKETNSPPAGLMGPRMTMVVSGNLDETDNLPTNGWREVSRSTNVLPALTFAMPSHGRVWEEALARGARRGYWRVPFDGWDFSGAGIGWTNGFIWAEGQFRPRVETKLDGVQVFDHHLALTPFVNWGRYGLDASMCWCATNSVGGLIGTYVGAAVDDDPAKIVNAQFELFPSNGMLALRYDLSRAGEGPFMVGPFEDGTSYRTAVSSNVSEVVFQQVHPDDWDMDGLPNGIDDNPRVASANAGWNQSAEWAARSFPSNASEIAAAGGYVAWATARGAQPNRHLIGLEISSPSNIWPICLTFGDKQVMCNGKEEIIFAIDDGARYAFSLSAGALALVTTHSSTTESWPCCLWQYPGDTWAYDLLVHLDSPSSGWISRVAEVLVDDSQLTHFYHNDSKQITSVVTNCHEDAYIGCEWHHGGNVTFSDPHSLTTTVFWDGDDVWATNYVELVTMYEGGYSITNTTVFTVGTQLEPNVEFSVSCQNVFFLNDADFLSGGNCTSNRPERIRPIQINLIASRGTEANATFSSSGSGKMELFFVDDNGVTNRITTGMQVPLNIPVSSMSREVGTTVYASCPKIGTGTLEVSCQVKDGPSIGTNISYRVIEPLRKLVTTKRVEGDGPLVNPSRLVYGTNAVLEVEVNGYFPSNNVAWNVVSGPGRVERHGFSAVVEATNDTGIVKVEARFNQDEIQPTFLLPIVRTRVIPVRAFRVSPPLDMRDNAWSDSAIRAEIDKANVIFSQAGIRFELVCDIATVGTTNNWIATYRMERLTNGKMVRVLTPETKSLMGCYTNHDCIEIYYLGGLCLKDGPIPTEVSGVDEIAGFHSRYGIAIGIEREYSTLAHELGHALGLADCEECFSGSELSDPNCKIGDQAISRGMFVIGSNDWGDESGRGFYDRTVDTWLLTIENLLMWATTYGQKADIPDDSVLGAEFDGNGNVTGVSTSVGVKNMKQTNEEVFTE